MKLTHYTLSMMLFFGITTLHAMEKEQGSASDNPNNNALAVVTSQGAPKDELQEIIDQMVEQLHGTMHDMEEEQGSASDNPNNNALTVATSQVSASAAAHLARIQRMLEQQNQKIEQQKKAEQKEKERAALKREVPSELFLVARIHSAADKDKEAMRESCIRWLQYKQQADNMKATGLP